MGGGTSKGATDPAPSASPVTSNANGEQNTEGAQLDGHIFDRAQSDVQKLMERDGFVRFKKSSLFVDFMKELGIAPAANRKGSITLAAPVAVPQLTSGP